MPKTLQAGHGNEEVPAQNTKGGCCAVIVGYLVFSYPLYWVYCKLVLFPQMSSWLMPVRFQAADERLHLQEDVIRQFALAPLTLPHMILMSAIYAFGGITQKITEAIFP